MRFVLPLLIFLTACSASNKNVSMGENYLGVPYLSDPLGEEQKPDPDPLIRFDAFDCVTFVETVLAGGDKNKLTKIRYKNGQISFLNRNHFIESDWLQNNSDIVENVSAKYGKTSVRTVVVDKKKWLKKIHDLNYDCAVETVNIEYIPYRDLNNLKLNESLIVLFIAGNSGKNDKIGTDLAVTHMGFLLPDGFFRHASSAAGKVVDVDFMDYVAKQEKNNNNLGITLVRIK